MANCVNCFSSANKAPFAGVIPGTKTTSTTSSSATVDRNYDAEEEEEARLRQHRQRKQLSPEQQALLEKLKRSRAERRERKKLR